MKTTFAFGFCYLFALYDLIGWLGKYRKASRKAADLKENLKEQAKYSSLSSQKELELVDDIQHQDMKSDVTLIDYWDYYRFKWHGRTAFRGFRFEFRLLTHMSPFIEDCICLSFGNINQTFEH